MQQTTKRSIGAVALVLAAAVGLQACSSGSSDSGATNEGDVTTLEL